MASRGHLRHFQTDAAGNAVIGALVYVKDSTNTNLLTLYAASSGGTTLSNPLTTSSAGLAEAWLDTPQSVVLTVTDNSHTATAGGVTLATFSHTVYAEVQYAPEDLASAAAPWISVKQSPYNATGDGTTNDATAIQSALTAAAGGVCFFPEGSYKTLASLVIPANTIVMGVGEGSVIKANSTLSGTIPSVFINTTTGAASDGARDVGTYIRDLFINMTSCATSTACGVTFDALVRGAVDRVRILAAPLDGIYLGASTATNTRPCEKITVNDSSIESVGRNGISVVSGKRIRVNDVFVDTPAQYGIDVEPNANGIAQDIVISECSVTNSVYEGIILGVSGSTLTADTLAVIGCTVRSSSDVTQGGGIAVDPGSNTVPGVRIIGNNAISCAGKDYRVATLANLTGFEFRANQSSACGTTDVRSYDTTRPYVSVSVWGID